jgi:hypothetical protein
MYAAAASTGSLSGFYLGVFRDDTALASFVQDANERLGELNFVGIGLALLLEIVIVLLRQKVQ